MKTLSDLEKELKRAGSREQAANLQRFFKTGPGQYGAGDVFLGIKVPMQRQIAKKYGFLGFEELKKMLASKFHEFRLVALLILVDKYQNAPSLREKERIVRFYLNQRARINNWDLVDLSVYKILGDYLVQQPGQRKILDQLAASKNLWERRLAMIATFAFLKKGEARETLALAKKLLNDPHDLMHKAVGWMLREMGKRVSLKTLEDFLEEAAEKMPRTALRYAIERLQPARRDYYLKK